MTRLEQEPQLQQTQHQSEQQLPAEQMDEPVRLLRIVNMLIRARWFIAIFTLLVAGAAAGYVMTLSPTYTATTKFMPSQSKSASARMGAIAGSAAQVTDVVVENTAPEYYTELLTSRAFLETLLKMTFDAPQLGGKVRFIDTLRIDGPSETERQELAIAALRLIVKVNSVKMKSTAAPPILTLTMTAADPQLAAQSANALVGELIRYNREVRGSKARDNRAFIERQLADATKALRDAEKALSEFNRLNRKIATPDLKADQERLARAVTVQAEVFITLTKQLEIARIQEQEDRVSIEVLEPAVAPLQRSAPRRTQTVLIAAIMAVFVACGLVLLRARLQSGDGSDPDVEDFKLNMRAVAREFTFGLVGRSAK